jgi:cell division protein FtsQ
VARGGNRRRIDRVPGERRLKLAGLLVRALPFAGGALALVAVGWAAWHFAVSGDLLRVREIRFEGLSRATAEELLELSPVRKGDHLLAVDPDVVASALQRHPWLASVEVRRRLVPPGLEVKVAERRAAAVVDLGGLYLVDDRGEVFKRATPGDGLDLPVVTGVPRDAWVERRGEVEPLLQGALALLSRWAERGLDRRTPISEIHLDPDAGTTVWAGDEGVEIRLGHGDLPDKLARLERVLTAVAAEGKRAEVLHLDNRRRPDWVAVRLAGGSGGGGGPGSSGARLPSSR